MASCAPSEDQRDARLDVLLSVPSRREIHLHQRLNICGVQMRALAARRMVGEMLFLAYCGKAAKHLHRYAVRWQAENLHTALKARGLNVENTGLTEGERISTVLPAVQVLFVWRA